MQRFLRILLAMPGLAWCAVHFEQSANKTEAQEFVEHWPDLAMYQI